jgi:PAS domain-containing protein
MASITENQGAEQKAILPRVRPLRLYRWIAMVLALASAAACLVLFLLNDGWNDAVLAAVALGLGANVCLALLTLIPDARGAQARLLSEMTGQSREGQMVTGRGGEILFMNGAGEGFFGADWANADLSGLSGDDGTVAETLQRLQTKALSGVSAQDEIRLTLPNGEIHGLEIRVHPIGEPIDKVAWYLSEATARQELRAVLHSEQALLTDFLDNAPVGFFRSIRRAGSCCPITRWPAGWGIVPMNWRRATTWAA